MGGGSPSNFVFVVYVFVEGDLSLMTDQETLIMSYFSKEILYNFKYEGLPPPTLC